MTTALSLILALMLSIGGSPAGGPGFTGIQAPIDNSCTINRNFEDYTPKTASRVDSKKILEIPSINHPKTQIKLSFQLCLKEKLYLRGYIDSMNLYQAFGMNPINFTDPMGADLYCSTVNSYYESKKYNPNFGMSSVFHSVMTGLAYGFDYIFRRAEEVENADWGHFGKQTAFDFGNLFTLGTLEKTAAQKDLDIGDKIWYFYNELPNRINNAGTFGLLDNLAAEGGKGLEGAGSALYRTLYEVSPVSNLYTIFMSDSSLENKIRAASFLPSKIAALFMITNPKIGNPNKFITENEQMGGHILGKHIGKTDANLMLRLMTSKNKSGKITINASSSFTDTNIAESVINTTIEGNYLKIKNWLKSDVYDNLLLKYEGGTVIGRGISRNAFLAGEGVSARTNAIIILKKVNKSKYFVLTAYPD